MSCSIASCTDAAFFWIREMIAGEPVRDELGDWWMTWRPGPMRGYCRAHQPQSPPLLPGLLC